MTITHQGEAIIMGNDSKLGARTFRRRATVEAVQWFKMGDHPGVIRRERWPEPRDESWVYWIGPLNAGFPVKPGDWLVSDRPGHWAPKKPEDFEAMYEPLTTQEKPSWQTK